MSLARRALCGTILLCTLLEAQDRRRRRTRPKSPESGKNDWPSLVQRAHSHPRMMLRRAIANRIAKAGAAAIPAVRAYAKDKGRNQLSLELVVAYQSSKTQDPQSLDLLRDWATDKDFYWRSQALGALARRRLPALEPLFAAALGGSADPSHLYRIEAARGLLLLDKPSAARRLMAADPDPRARLQTALMLSEQGMDEALPTLGAALRQEHSFLDLPWGSLGALQAFKRLRKVLGEDHGYETGAALAKNRAAIARIEAAIKARLGERYRAAQPLPADPRAYRGGLSIRSCRNGDYFLRWTAAGELFEGLEAKPLPEATPQLGPLLAKLPGASERVVGRVICDYLRLVDEPKGLDLKAAPAALPDAATAWLHKLPLPAAFRARLEQFEAPR